jgi:AcrR family transcriptional regulator
MDRREAILEAALDAFAETGTTAIADVRTRSGASVGSIYHHFGGKEGIEAALYVEILRRYQEGVLRTLGDAPHAQAGVEALVRHHLRWVERNPERARFLFQGRVAREQEGEEIKALNQRLFGAIDDWVEGHTAIHQLRREVFYAAVFGPAQELCRSWLAGRTKSLRRLEDELAEAAWRAVRSE